MDVGLRAYGLRNPSFAVPLLREGLHMGTSKSCSHGHAGATLAH